MGVRVLLTVVNTKLVYDTFFEVHPSFSVHDTFTVYSFGWVFDGKRGYLELCNCAVAELEQVEARRVSCRVYAGSSCRCWEEGLESIEKRLGLREDYSGFMEAASRDPILACIPSAIPGFRLRSVSVWAATLIAVCQQNASFRQGWGMLYKLHVAASTRLRLPNGRVYLVTPSPDRINIDVLRGAGLGYRAKTVMSVVKAGLHNISCDEVDRLAEVRGVGSYTLALVKLLACRDYGVAPIDRWVKAIASKAYNVPGDAAAEEFAKRFGSWRGLAILLTTVALDAEPLRKALRRLEEGRVCPGQVKPSPINMWQWWRAPEPL